MQRLDENIINYLSGYHGDTSKLSKEEKFGLIAGGVLEEGFIGGAWGPVFGAQGYRYAKQLHTAQK